MFAFITFALNAQSLSQSVIAPTGGFAANVNGSFSYTTAEMALMQTFNNSVILTQGFQQPTENVAGLMAGKTSDFGSFMLYPNPAIDKLWWTFQLSEPGNMNLVIRNVFGQPVTETYSTYEAGKTVETINTSALAAGIYFLTAAFIFDKGGSEYLFNKKFEIIR